MSTFYENFIALCKREKLPPSVVLDNCEISRGSLTRWKNGSIPRDTVLQTLAEYFRVPVSKLTQWGAFDTVNDTDAPLEWAQADVEADARAARRVQIFERTANMNLSQLEQLLGMIDVMFPAEGK